MGKLNVALLRYLTSEDFRVLTAVCFLCSREESVIALLIDSRR